MIIKVEYKDYDKDINEVIIDNFQEENEIDNKLKLKTFWRKIVEVEDTCKTEVEVERRIPTIATKCDIDKEKMLVITAEDDTNEITFTLDMNDVKDLTTLLNRLTK